MLENMLFSISMAFSDFSNGLWRVALSLVGDRFWRIPLVTGEEFADPFLGYPADSFFEYPGLL